MIDTVYEERARLLEREYRMFVPPDLINKIIMTVVIPVTDGGNIREYGFMIKTSSELSRLNNLFKIDKIKVGSVHMYEVLQEKFRNVEHHPWNDDQIYVVVLRTRQTEHGWTRI